jgi:3-hydroxyacyl-CoA dehydrogenase/enoyl-CoA hydratase/3-hydroxybutyryl-CoA epimerase
MINEAAKCLDGVVHEAWAVDLGMVLGTGFAPFRGGPLHVADAIGVPLLVSGLEELSRSCGNRYEPCTLLKEMAAEKRSFFGTKPEKPLKAVAAG